MSAVWKEDYKKKVVTSERLEAWSNKLKDEGKSIATLNGSFDLMHAGHLHIIFEAAKAADVLLVALNSDTSIQKYKSLNRPIIALEYRMQMMAALGFVDFVTCFEETDPIAMLEKVKPHFHVNGIEYGEDCIEREVVERNGGSIHVVGLIPGLSTTEIINKILKVCV